MLVSVIPPVSMVDVKGDIISDGTISPDCPPTNGAVAQLPGYIRPVEIYANVSGYPGLPTGGSGSGKLLKEIYPVEIILSVDVTMLFGTTPPPLEGGAPLIDDTVILEIDAADDSKYPVGFTVSVDTFIIVGVSPAKGKRPLIEDTVRACDNRVAVVVFCAFRSFVIVELAITVSVITEPVGLVVSVDTVRFAGTGALGEYCVPFTDDIKRLETDVAP